MTGSSKTSRALLKRVIISGSPPLSGWCWTASNLWACFTWCAFKRPVKGNPRLWRALMASISGSRPKGHCSRRWLAFPGFRLAFEALERFGVALPNPPIPLGLLLTLLLVTGLSDCNVTSQCLTAHHSRRNTISSHHFSSERAVSTVIPLGSSIRVESTGTCLLLLRSSTTKWIAPTPLRNQIRTKANWAPMIEMGHLSHLKWTNQQPIEPMKRVCKLLSDLKLREWL